MTAALLAILSLGASAQCTQVQLNFNSNMAEQGPSFVQWYASVYQGNTFNQGVCQFSPNDAECSATLCLENGCFTFLITSAATIAPWQVDFSVNVTVGGQTVTQELQSYNPGGNQYSFTIGVNEDCVACDMNIVTMQEQDNVLVLQATETAPGAQIYWTQNGQQVNVGAITTFLLQPGANEICASYETPECPQGVFWCETFFYQPFPDCLSTVLVHPLTCNTYVFDFAGNDVQADVIWNFGDGQFGEGLSVTHIFEENGTYVVTATYTGIDCPEPVVQQVTVEVTCGGGSECPTEMVYEQTSCGHYTFSIPGASAQSTVFWNIGNNLVTNNGQPISFEFAPGTYQGYAIYQAVGCAPTTFVVNFTVESCNTDGCPSEILVSDVNGCGTYAFALLDFPQFGDITWTWGDGGSNTGANGAFHSYPTPGTYEVCVVASSEACPQGVEICIPLTVTGCNIECPSGIDVVELGCGLYGFEVGSAASVSGAMWNFGDGTIESGGHYVTHQFTEPGVYVIAVNASLTIPCFNNYFVVTVVVEECEEECHVVNIALTPTGSPSSWWLSNENGEAIYETNCEGSLCMTELCLPDGCYNLHHVPNIGGDNVFEVFSQTVDVSIELVYVGDATNVYLLSVGQDCSDECPEVGFVLESNYMMGGPLQAVWFLTGEGVDLEGFASLTPNTPVYDWAECLPDGCYTLNVIGQNMQNPAAFGIDLTGGWEVVSEDMEQEGGQYYYTFELALNSDCGQQPDCFEGGFYIDSFMNLGGPHEATWVIVSEGENWGEGDTGFSVQDPYYDFNGCLPTGCYVLHVTGYGNDNSEAFSVGIVESWTAENVEIVENGSQIHYYIEFSVNGGCENGDCSMEIQAQTADGFSYYFSATESSGVQPMGWILPGNEFISGSVLEYEFTEAGTYEVCAVYEAPGCVLTECVEVVVEGCYLTTLTISAEFSEFELQVLTWFLESEGFELDGEIVLTEINNTLSFTACLPADCYSLTLDTPGGVLNALAASVMISVNGATISMTDWPEDAGSYTIEFGIMADCGDSVGENAQTSTLSVFPNPSSGLFNLKTGSQWTGAQARIFDMAGREVSAFRIQSEMTGIALNDLATGIYLLQLSGTNGTETVRLNLFE